MTKKDAIGSTNAEQAYAEALQQQDLFMASVSPELLQEEDAIARTVGLMNSGARSKLRKVYALVDKLVDAAGPFVACERGCSACCHINISITETEAQIIEAQTGRRYTRLPAPVRHPEGKFTGAPCPFLADGACSIYSVRPFVCRHHLSFNLDAYWCAPERAHLANMPMVSFGAAKEAYREVTRLHTSGVYGDIRDFFPAV
ncbi:YkgJ family cysteine cluster protein [Ralstonia sp. ASV6]|uniref:YkgJ family cysteine cluster protein n=1 Tax=Ralstonia sp. ASV6 TaxID=2795124 RepID=UPI0018EBFD2F|nr:YkgJ family cysteine cluster protein [Ralstonia sp. ASV6]